MFYRNTDIPFVVDRPSDDETMNAIANAMILMENENINIAKMKEQEIEMGIYYD
jgi:hypothetical protein